jgi:hypothetical protein
MSTSDRAPEAGGRSPAGLRALVVDDKPPLVKVVSSYLEREGFDVAIAGDGERAVDLARGFDPDVIVLDLMLPGDRRDRGEPADPLLQRRLYRDAARAGRGGRPDRRAVDRRRRLRHQAVLARPGPSNTRSGQKGLWALAGDGTRQTQSCLTRGTRIVAKRRCKRHCVGAKDAAAAAQFHGASSPAFYLDNRTHTLAYGGGRKQGGRPGHAAQAPTYGDGAR